MRAWLYLLVLLVSRPNFAQKTKPIPPFYPENPDYCPKEYNTRSPCDRPIDDLCLYELNPQCCSGEPAFAELSGKYLHCVNQRWTPHQIGCPKDLCTLRKQQLTEITPENWLSSLPDEIPVSKVFLVGTHDSCTYEVQMNMVVQYRTAGTCQYYDIPTQLDLGVRFLDIRVNSDNLKIVHGSDDVYYDTPVTLFQVINEVIEFLDLHQTEFVVLRIKKERGTSLENANLKVILDRNVTYSSFYWNGSTIPFLGEVRKRFIVWNDYDKNNESFIPYDSIILPKQDNYVIEDCNTYQKKKDVDCTLEREYDSERWLINYISGSAPTALQLCNCPPISIANQMNSWVLSLLEREKEQCKKDVKTCPHGVIVFDFIEASISSKVASIQSGFNRTIEPSKTNGDDTRRKNNLLQPTMPVIVGLSALVGFFLLYLLCRSPISFIFLFFIVTTVTLGSHLARNLPGREWNVLLSLFLIREVFYLISLGLVTCFLAREYGCTFANGLTLRETSKKHGEASQLLSSTPEAVLFKERQSAETVKRDLEGAMKAGREFEAKEALNRNSMESTKAREDLTSKLREQEGKLQEEWKIYTVCLLFYVIDIALLLVLYLWAGLAGGPKFLDIDYPHICADGILCEGVTLVVWGCKIRGVLYCNNRPEINKDEERSRLYT